jgi:hypothetical protein
METYKAHFKARTRDAFPGMAAEIERQWDAVWAEHQRQEMLVRLSDDLLASKRERMQGML